MSSIQSLVNKETLDLLAVKGLCLKIGHSDGIVNPRKDSHATWVGIDTKMPNTHLDTKTIADYATAYFKGRGLDQTQYLWCAVSPDDKENGTKTNLYPSNDCLLGHTEGFIFIKTSTACLLLNIQPHNADVEKVKFQVKALFTDEVKKYRAWHNDNIFDISITAKSDAIFNTQIKDCYNISENNISTAINDALMDINNQIEAAQDAITLTLNLDIDTSEEKAGYALEYIVARLNDGYNLHLTIGHYSYDKFNHTLSFTFLGRSVSGLAEIRQACKQDFDILELMSTEMTRLVKFDGFNELPALEVAAALMDGKEFNDMPDIMQQALLRSILTNIIGVTIEELVWKNT
ncbi:MAG: hypothetical protein J6N72_02545 [Psychrobacter sp.]|nr:hypothetical protein [Psychrobacter sp.]